LSLSAQDKEHLFEAAHYCVAVPYFIDNLELNFPNSVVIVAILHSFFVQKLRRNFAPILRRFL
jgi:hypothetical protein